MTDPTRSTLNFRNGLEAAFQDDSFCLYAQPIAPLRESSRATTFQEILVRLREEESKLLPPGAFLPLLEEYGMLSALDHWVTANVMMWLAKDAARQRGVYSINVSAQSLATPKFALAVLEGLRACNLPARLLCFEITESVAAKREADAASFVSTIGKTGCATALSGFGGSEASLPLLRAFKTDFLKIDGSIVLKAARDPKALAKVKAIVQVAGKRGCSTVAEFVEDEQTLEVLREAGVDWAQGFGIARPCPIDELELSGPVISPA